MWRPRGHALTSGYTNRSQEQDAAAASNLIQKSRNFVKLLNWRAAKPLRRAACPCLKAVLVTQEKIDFLRSDCQRIPRSLVHEIFLHKIAIRR
jgi:hypothetical protein